MGFAVHVEANLQGRQGQGSEAESDTETMNVHPINNESLPPFSALSSHPFSILRFLKILANLLRPLKLWVMSSFLVPSSILIWASA